MNSQHALPPGVDETAVLVVIILKGRNLVYPNRKPVETYVRLKLPYNQIAQSRKIFPSEVTEWNDEVRMKVLSKRYSDPRGIMRHEDVHMGLEVYGDTGPSGSILLGKASIPVGSWWNSQFDEWVDLYMNGAVCGQVYLEMTLYPNLSLKRTMDQHHHVAGPSPGPPPAPILTPSPTNSFPVQTQPQSSHVIPRHDPRAATGYVPHSQIQTPSAASSHLQRPRAASSHSSMHNHSASYNGSLPGLSANSNGTPTAISGLGPRPGSSSGFSTPRRPLEQRRPSFPDQRRPSFPAQQGPASRSSSPARNASAQVSEFPLTGSFPVKPSTPTQASKLGPGAQAAALGLYPQLLPRIEGSTLAALQPKKPYAESPRTASPGRHRRPHHTNAPSSPAPASRSPMIHNQMPNYSYEQQPHFQHHQQQYTYPPERGRQQHQQHSSQYAMPSNPNQYPSGYMDPQSRLQIPHQRSNAVLTEIPMSAASNHGYPSHTNYSNQPSPHSTASSHGDTNSPHQSSILPYASSANTSPKPGDAATFEPHRFNRPYSGDNSRNHTNTPRSISLQQQQHHSHQTYPSTQTSTVGSSYPSATSHGGHPNLQLQNHPRSSGGHGHVQYGVTNGYSDSAPRTRATSVEQLDTTQRSEQQQQEHSGGRSATATGAANWDQEFYNSQREYEERYKQEKLDAEFAAKLAAELEEEQRLREAADLEYAERLARETRQLTLEDQPSISEQERLERERADEEFARALAAEEVQEQWQHEGNRHSQSGTYQEHHEELPYPQNQYQSHEYYDPHQYDQQQPYDQEPHYSHQG